jgi:hypothetical protein
VELNFFFCFAVAAAQLRHSSLPPLSRIQLKQPRHQVRLVLARLLLHLHQPFSTQIGRTTVSFSKLQ